MKCFLSFSLFLFSTVYSVKFEIGWVPMLMGIARGWFVVFLWRFLNWFYNIFIFCGWFNLLFFLFFLSILLLKMLRLGWSLLFWFEQIKKIYSLKIQNIILVRKKKLEASVWVEGSSLVSFFSKRNFVIFFVWKLCVCLPLLDASFVLVWLYVKIGS